MRRIASVALFALLVSLVPAAAAQAAPEWRLTLTNVSVEPGGAAKALRLQYSVLPPADVPGGALVFDLAAVNAIATVTPWAGSACTSTATTLTCPGTVTQASLPVTAKPGATVGASARLTVRAVVDGRTRATATGRVTIAEQVALSTVDTQGDVTLATGASTGLAASVRNSGTTPVTGVVLELSTVRGITSAPHSNCAPVEFGAACLFDSELAPGATYRLATPWQITASPAVWAPSQWTGSFAWHTAQDWADLDRPRPVGSGPALELTPASSTLADPQTETDPDDNSDGWGLVITGVNQSNFTAKGATAQGQVGKTVTVRLGVRNNGPARIEGWGSAQGSYLTVTVTPPAGTTVVRRSPLCGPLPTIGDPGPGAPYPGDAHPDDGKFYCFTSPVEGVPYLPGQTVNFDFTLRIDKPGALRGTIRTARGGPAPAGDPDPSDNSAAIVINATGANPATGDDGGSGDGGGLPITGSNSMAAALIGLLLLVAGAATRFATRRR